MGKVISCCKDCQERHPRCHGTCERYKAERAALDKEAAEREIRRQGSYGVLDSMELNRIYRKKRLGGRKNG